MTELPELFDLRVKARSFAYLFAAGAVVGVLTLHLPAGGGDGAAAGDHLGGSRCCSRLASGPTADRVREWHLHVLLCSATVLLTLANYYAGVGALYALLFSWVAALRLLLLRPARGASRTSA